MKSFMRMEKREDGVHFQGVIRWDEWPNLDAFDRALVSDCGGTARTAADWLLGLECLFRRANEQFAAHDEPKKEAIQPIMQEAAWSTKEKS